MKVVILAGGLGTRLSEETDPYISQLSLFHLHDAASDWQINISSRLHTLVRYVRARLRNLDRCTQIHRRPRDHAAYPLCI